VQGPEVLASLDAGIGAHEVDEIGLVHDADRARDGTLLAAAEDVAAEPVAGHQPSRRVTHRLEALELKGQMRCQLVARWPRFGRIGR
jgi:hypothetical protein